MKDVFYENERIVVTEVQNKVRIVEKFLHQSMILNKESFEQMCRDVAEKEKNERESKHKSS